MAEEGLLEGRHSTGNGVSSFRFDSDKEQESGRNLRAFTVACCLCDRKARKSTFKMLFNVEIAVFSVPGALGRGEMNVALQMLSQTCFLSWRKSVTRRV